MRALVFREGVPRLDRAYPLPKPQPGEALIRVNLAGICATDLAILSGYGALSGVMGHEFAGTVEQAPGAPEWHGRRVAGEINLPCHDCIACRRGVPAHCIVRKVIGIRDQDGAFADGLILPLANLHPLPDLIPDEAAVFIEPLAAALAITRDWPVSPAERIAVTGDGKLGLLVAQVLGLTGCDVVVIGRHAKNWGVLEKRGIPALLEPDAESLSGAMDRVVECSGSPTGLRLAQRLVRPKGQIILKSTLPQALPFDFAALTVDEITLSGSRCGPFPAAIRLLSQGVIATTPLIDGVFSLDEAEAALKRAAERGVLKVLIRP
nr:Zinc-containing alcohol dehydrogenase superfamily protein [uncultured bacterium]